VSSVSLAYLEAAKILTYTALSFFLALWWGPSLIEILYDLKFWKKHSRSISTSGENLVVTAKFYEENEKKRLVPRGGGILIWGTTLAIAAFFWLVLKIHGTPLTQFLNFVSRQETFIPLGTLFFGSMLGLIDDSLATMPEEGNYKGKGGGLHLNQRLLMVAGFSFLISLWFYFRLQINMISVFGFKLDLLNLPGLAGMNLAWLIIPITLIVLVFTWSTGIIDGFDGLAGGVFVPVYLCFAGLAFARGYFDVTALLMVLAGSTMAFLWYNIPPAKFFMGDTGTVGGLLIVGVVAILINYIYILPIAGFILFLTSFSAVIQVFSKKVFKRKVFLAAPLHHHLEAIGWERNQVTMRYWLISIMTSALGLAIGLIFR
jgi:phospho-N-acetylmuramoyl-pentapeptide-transferase